MLQQIFNNTQPGNEPATKDYFPSLKSFLDEKGDRPDDYIKACFIEYRENIRKKVIENRDISFLKEFIENFRQFVFLDWQNLVNDLINAKNGTVFYLIALMKQKEILPKNLCECPAFQKYQEIISDKEKLKEFFDSEGLKDNLKIKSVDKTEYWMELESGSESKSYYILSIECGSYVRSVGTDENKNVVDVSSDVVLTKGISFKPALDNDEIIYLEVEDV
jgi:hypothetical protein